VHDFATGEVETEYPVMGSPPVEVALDQLVMMLEPFGTMLTEAGAPGRSTPVPEKVISVRGEPALGVRMYRSDLLPTDVGANRTSTLIDSPTGIVVPSSTGRVDVKSLTGGLALTMVTGRFPPLVMEKDRIFEEPTAT
jgi:hypothetical protein